MAVMSLPGFRFSPTDIELVLYFLKRKITGKKFCFEAIAEVDIYKFHPSDLPGQSCLRTRDLEWYFFCPRRRRNNNTVRTNRATDNGYWKTTGKDRTIVHNSQTVGMKKTLIFHHGRAPDGVRTNWVIYEYRLEEACIDACFSKDAYVLCKLYEKSGLGPKNGEQRGAPFREEDWDDDADDGSAVPAPAISSSSLLNCQSSYQNSIPPVSSAIMEGWSEYSLQNFAITEGNSLEDIQPWDMDFLETRDLGKMLPDLFCDDDDSAFTRQQMSNYLEHPGLPPLSIYESILLEGHVRDDFRVFNDHSGLAFEQGRQGFHHMYSCEGLGNELHQTLVNFDVEPERDVCPPCIEKNHLDFPIKGCCSDLVTSSNVLADSPAFQFGYNEEIAPAMLCSFSTPASEEHPGLPPLSIYESILLDGHVGDDFRVFNDHSGLAFEQGGQGFHHMYSCEGLGNELHQTLVNFDVEPERDVCPPCIEKNHLDFPIKGCCSDLVTSSNVLADSPSFQFGYNEEIAPAMVCSFSTPASEFQENHMC